MKKNDIIIKLLDYLKNEIDCYNYRTAIEILEMIITLDEMEVKE